MRTRLLHAILSGVIVALVLGFYLIPETWRLISREPTFEPITADPAIAGIAASVAVIAAALLSFRFARRIED